MRQARILSILGFKTASVLMYRMYLEQEIRRLTYKLPHKMKRKGWQRGFHNMVLALRKKKILDNETVTIASKAYKKASALAHGKDINCHDVIGEISAICKELEKI